MDGRKDVLGLWAGSSGEGAKFWISVLIDLKNRGVRDVFFVVCDGLKGLSDTVEAVWPEVVVQACIVDRALPARGPRSRAFPVRAGRVEVSVSCDPQPGPDRGRPRPMDDALEACAERLRHHVR